MRKFILLMCLVQFLGCNSTKDSSTKASVKNSFLGVNQNISKLEKDVVELYKELKIVQYRFNGDRSQEVVPYVIGKSLVVPITPSKLEDSDYLSIGLIIDLEKKTEKVLLDGLMINYPDFKNILDKGNEWIAKTNSFNAKQPLEMSLIEKMNIEFPQSKEPRVFEGVMIFSDGVRGREIMLREIGDPADENLVNISLKKEHIAHLAEALSSLYIEGALNLSNTNIEKEIQDVKNQYIELKTLLK
ncbi:MAG: hypothetical protein ACRCY7_11145 [Cetobacterium sp.]|uniref:hypothetical protein n=1 Tax=Cetobacterium sp. TaxID=2071632 RepID=UPI003F2B1264